MRPRLHSSILLWIMALLGPGCDRRPERGDRLPATGSVRVPAARPSGSASRAALAASALVEIRSRALSLGAPGETNRRIAFGKGFLLQLASSQAALLESTSCKVIATVPLSSPRGALSVPGGGVLAIAGDRAYRFDPGEKRAHPLGNLLLLPGALLVQSRESMDRVWVFPSQVGRAERYDFGADAGLGPSLERAMPKCDGRVAAAMSGGDLVCASGDDLTRLSGGQLTELKVPSEALPVWRLAAAEHIDHVWLATRRGDLFLLELTARVRVLRTLRTGWTPIDFATTPKRLALVEVIEKTQEPRLFRLHVLRYDGVELFSHDIARQPVTADADWAAIALRDREVVIAEQPPRVAVGGATRVQIFDLTDGQPLCRR